MRSRLFGLSLPTLAALGACFVAGCDNHATTPRSLGTRITWSFCANGTGDLAEPTWLAVQDGTEPWTRVQPAADGSFAFTITHGVGGVAWTSVAAAAGTTSTLTVVHGTTQELSQSPSVLCPTAGGVATLAVTSVDPAELATVAFGSSSGLTAGSGTVALANVPSGMFDLLATKSVIGRGGQPNGPATSLIIRRAIDAVALPQQPVIDFGSAEAIALTSTPLAIDNSSGSTICSATTTASSTLQTLSTAIPLSVQSTNGIPSSLPVTVVPLGSLSASDFDHFTVQTHESGCTAFVADSRRADLFAHAPTGETVALGPALGAVAVSDLGGGNHARLRASYAPQQAYDGRWTVTYVQQPDASSARVVTVTATAGYLGAATPADLDVPDFSSVTGWNDAWGLQRGSSGNASWDFTAASAVTLPLASSALTPPTATTSFRSGDRRNAAFHP